MSRRKISIQRVKVSANKEILKSKKDSKSKKVDQNVKIINTIKVEEDKSSLDQHRVVKKEELTY